MYGTTPDALGAPTQVIVDFFNARGAAPLRVFDVGCGHGRDALFIARLGHSVVGVDLSAHGIRDLNTAAASEGLKIIGEVADITTYAADGLFDVVLIDRTLHMLGRQARIDVLTKLIGHVAPKGWLLIADEKSNMADFKAVIADDAADWAATLDKGGTLFLQRD
ncbi:Tellurite resistance protein TehB [Yoonia tamlensis]|uniref:Tellurite resistance protein TehB n=1 Tax=Yoonia tamlensis TaxID=390270 RepID=A0A1I6FP00_9RHOB|nr:class I SAM-dependent methyltransferase [Yoonia tamlensis]SFR31673.1 Tellurite resistance protein TehB [Yoonia tamlensis]